MYNKIKKYFRPSCVYVVMLETYLESSPDIVITSVDDVYYDKDNAKNRVGILVTKGFGKGPLKVKSAWVICKMVE